MTINALVQMAKRIHDVEGWDLGSASTRETRNAFWAKVIGCAYWGHAVYNPVPDPQWHLKKADATRPQTDDVATSMPSRNHWDCIPGAGADGYSFAATPHGPLPAEQIVYAPPKPDGSQPQPEPVPPPVTLYPYPDEPTYWKRFQDGMKSAYASVGRLFPDPNDPDAYQRFSRGGYDCKTNPADAMTVKHMRELRDELQAPPLCGQPVPGTDGMSTPPQSCIYTIGHDGPHR